MQKTMLVISFVLTSWLIKCNMGEQNGKVRHKLYNSSEEEIKSRKISLQEIIETLKWCRSGKENPQFLPKRYIRRKKVHKTPSFYEVRQETNEQFEGVCDTVAQLLEDVLIEIGSSSRES